MNREEFIQEFEQLAHKAHIARMGGNTEYALKLEHYKESYYYHAARFEVTEGELLEIETFVIIA